ncbi:ATP-binding protein [Paenibacillus konkukensis]|uniref:ATP-binding protein n=1 Tax=Paenibacillus konkukensis TaxID=2020716 RepID=UPI00201D2FD3|nr:ATP-binding protein [Paenibacillus konkukensis]
MGDNKHLAIELDAPTGLMVEWDEVKFTQMLILLVDNGVKYAPENGAVQVKLADMTVKGDGIPYIKAKLLQGIRHSNAQTVTEL